MDWARGLLILQSNGTTTTELFTVPLVSERAAPFCACAPSPARSRANGTLMGQASQSEVPVGVDVRDFM